MCAGSSLASNTFVLQRRSSWIKQIMVIYRIRVLLDTFSGWANVVVRIVRIPYGPKKSYSYIPPNVHTPYFGSDYYVLLSKESRVTEKASGIRSTLQTNTKTSGGRRSSAYLQMPQQPSRSSRQPPHGNESCDVVSSLHADDQPATQFPAGPPVHSEPTCIQRSRMYSGE